MRVGPVSNADLQQFYQTQERNRALYTAVQISHPAITTIRLAHDQFGDITLRVDGIDRTFNGATFVVPEQAILASDQTEKGALSFNRIGYDVLEELRKTDDYIGFDPISVRVLQYLENITDPVSDYTAFADEVSLDARNVTIPLTVENFEKQTKADQIYTTDEFPGTGI